MKALKPSHREHKRYLLLEGKNSTKRDIEEAILKFVGLLGYAKASPELIKNTKDKTILAINRQEINNVKTSFLLSGKDIKIKKVSGMINKL